MSPTCRSPRPSRFGLGRTGWSAKSGTCSASVSTGISITGGFYCPKNSPPIRCVRIIHCKAAANGTTSPCLPEIRVEMPLEPATLTNDIAHDERQDYLWTLNFGPQHPATHTTLRIVMKLDGERVVDAMPDIGYLHSGFEKIGESLDYNQYVTVTDRMNYISPMANNVAWHGAVEKLMGIELTPRCKYIRTIICELARVSDHLLCNGAVGLDSGAFTFFLYAFNKREDI